MLVKNRRWIDGDQPFRELPGCVPKDNQLVIVPVFHIVHAEVAYDKEFGLDGFAGFPCYFQPEWWYYRFASIIWGSQDGYCEPFLPTILQKYFGISNFQQKNAYFQGVPVVRQ